jgi:hypothetical protein
MRPPDARGEPGFWFDVAVLTVIETAIYCVYIRALFALCLSLEGYNNKNKKFGILALQC